MHTLTTSEVGHLSTYSMAIRICYYIKYLFLLCESLITKCRILWQSSHFFGLCIGGLYLSTCFCSVQLFVFPIVGLLSSPFDTSYLLGTLLFPILFLNLCTRPRVHVKRLSSLPTGFLPPISVCNIQSEGNCF